MRSSPLVYGAAASLDSIREITLSPLIGRDEKTGQLSQLHQRV